MTKFWKLVIKLNSELLSTTPNAKSWRTIWKQGKKLFANLRIPTSLVKATNKNSRCVMAIFFAGCGKEKLTKIWFSKNFQLIFYDIVWNGGSDKIRKRPTEDFSFFEPKQAFSIFLFFEFLLSIFYLIVWKGRSNEIRKQPAEDFCCFLNQKCNWIESKLDEFLNRMKFGSDFRFVEPKTTISNLFNFFSGRNRKAAKRRFEASRRGSGSGAPTNSRAIVRHEKSWQQKLGRKYENKN